MSTYRSMIQVALCGLVVAASHLSAQSTPMWRYTATAEIALGPVTPIGSLLFTTPGQLVALDPATGTASWKLEDLQITGDRWWISALSWTPYGLLDLGDRLAVIDLQTGARRWDTTTLLIGSLKGYLAVPERLLLLVYGVWGSDSSVLAAVDVASGQVRWRHLDPFTTPPKRYRALTSGQRQLGSSLADDSPALWVTDSTFLLYLSEERPRIDVDKHGTVLAQVEQERAVGHPQRRALIGERFGCATGRRCGPTHRAFRVASFSLSSRRAVSLSAGYGGSTTRSRTALSSTCSIPRPGRHGGQSSSGVAGACSIPTTRRPLSHHSSSVVSGCTASPKASSTRSHLAMAR